MVHRRALLRLSSLSLPAAMMRPSYAMAADYVTRHPASAIRLEDIRFVSVSPEVRVQYPGERHWSVLQAPMISGGMPQAAQGGLFSNDLEGPPSRLSARAIDAAVRHFSNLSQSDLRRLPEIPREFSTNGGFTQTTPEQQQRNVIAVVVRLYLKDISDVFTIGKTRQMAFFISSRIITYGHGFSFNTTYSSYPEILINSTLRDEADEWLMQYIDSSVFTALEPIR
jgi:hypothetical protein